MKSCSPRQRTERAQPWLGTLVSISVDGLPRADAHAAISAAFQEVALVHRLMSFHQPDSDVSRINRHGIVENVEVHPHTLDVLSQALELSSATDGCFDVSVGAELVLWGWLPKPAIDPQLPHGTWRDIEITTDRKIRLRQPLWIDLGGIAKGYAVDLAAERLRKCGVTRAVVNAGGDIRVLGQQSEQIVLGLNRPCETLPIVELSAGSIASSSRNVADTATPVHGPHVDGIHRSPTTSNRFVCVLSERCVIADALTKVVMARGLASEPVLRNFGASAHILDGQNRWHSLNPLVDIQ